jgi:hypothetical protein
LNISNLNPGAKLLKYHIFFGFLELFLKRKTMDRVHGSVNHAHGLVH